jgi:hypothetical protein
MVVALAIDPLLGEEQPSEPEPDSEALLNLAELAPVEEAQADGSTAIDSRPSSTPAPRAVSASPLSPEDTPVRDRGGLLTPAPVVFSLEPFALVDAGSVPGPALGFGATVGVEFSVFRLDVLGTVLPPTRAQVDQVSGEAGLESAALRGCWLTNLDSVDLGLCLRGEIGRLTVRGLDVADGRQAERLWLAPGLGGRGFLPISNQLALSASLDALAPLIRDEFVVQGTGVLHRPSAVVGRLSLGIEGRFR